MKLSDYIVQYLVQQGVNTVFMVTGGGSMHINDSLGKEASIRKVFNHHEQASAMAAEAYARIIGNLGVINVTTGPGGINAINGVFGAWTDSVPMLIISGQVKRETIVGHHKLPLRQLGDQECDIVNMVQGITKYSVMITEPETIRFHLEKALFLAISGRPGPVWLDIPLDVQAAQIDAAELTGFSQEQDQSLPIHDKLIQLASDVLAHIRKAKRPVLMVGTGIRRAKAEEILDQVIEKLGIPVAPAWGAYDLMPSDHRLFAGRPGTVGDRAGNFVVQNADLLLVLGSRLNIRQVSYNWNDFARKAYKIMVDADQLELKKSTVRPDFAIHCDVREFLAVLSNLLDSNPLPKQYANWIRWCQERVRRYPVVTENNCLKTDFVNPYYFVDRLTRRLNGDDVIACGNAMACVTTFQAAYVSKGMRMFTNSGCASMGYDLPAAIGTALAQNGKRVICMAGDGSIQMNLQELQTIVNYRLPVKIFVFNNGGYLSIRTTQKSFFEGRLVGESSQSGVSFPDLLKVANAYGIRAQRVFDNEKLLSLFDEMLEDDEPFICELMIDPKQEMKPRLTSKQLDDGSIVSAPLEDMYPFLSKDELMSNMIGTK
ncbi:MAG: thiamine pyrophosphate-binding protein [Desulfosporosinus sp.]|nr:thiamine pyrophosphate-binding protein [Desulfosporosinus sp.]